MVCQSYLINTNSIPRSVKQVIKIMTQVVSGVEYLHMMGIYHLDLKIDNLITVQGTVKIIDFEGVYVVKNREEEQNLGRSFGFSPPGTF